MARIQGLFRLRVVGLLRCLSLLALSACASSRATSVGPPAELGGGGAVDTRWDRQGGRRDGGLDMDWAKRRWKRADEARERGARRGAFINRARAKHRRP
ncbi:MAG: hypothetical protein OXR73_26640 [Myxococcales bacterium]|nr:hypothetical protein [Myxococcales bacterium]